MSAAALLDQLAAAGYRAFLKSGGVLRVEPPPPPELLAELRIHKADVLEELKRRRQGQRSVGSEIEGAAEIAACAREDDLLRRVQTGLGAEIDVMLWRVLDRLLESRDLQTAEALWRHVVSALRRDILSRLVGWVRSLDLAGPDIAGIRALVATGPAQHPYHDAGASK